MQNRQEVEQGFRWLISREAGYQFGEQGVLAAIAEALHDLPKTCVEFGAGNANDLPVLVGPFINAGWSVRLIESDSDNWSSLKEKYPTSDIVLARVAADTIGVVDDAFSEPATIVVVDVDGDDLTLAKAMRKRPAVLVVEHWDEADPGNPRSAALPKNAGETSIEGYCTQANSAAVAQELGKIGYTPVWVGRINGVYVRNDVAGRVRRKMVRPDAETRLNIGGGDTQIEGFINVDRRNGMEAYPLPYDDDTITDIRASHILEHFPIDQTHAVLRDWVRVLKPGGRIRISVPDTTKLAQQINNPTWPVDLNRLMYGGQTDSNDFHKCGFDEAGLAVEMARAGLIAIARWKDDVRDNAGCHPVSLNLEGYKPTTEMRDASYLRKIVGVQSVPRLTFTEAENCQKRIQRALGIDTHVMQGAFWGQCLERGMEKAIASGAEWILCTDYDTVFSLADVQKLCLLLEANPDVGAIAPLQMKRGDNAPLMNVEKGTGDLSLFRGPLVDVTLAHFGCTLIRVSALQKLEHPWFLPVPNAEGKWEDGRLDEDIYFWKKFREAGNRVCVAPRVCVGHMQLIVTWPDEHLRPIHQHTKEWMENGAPANRRH
jgi:SAM-dependent methyltransferase